MRVAALAGALAVLGCVACSDSVLGPQPSVDHASLFDDLWREFDRHYSFFQLKGIDWAAIGARYRPQALAAASDAEFATVLAKMLAELHDPHVSLTPFGPGSTMRYLSHYDTVTTYFSAAATMQRYAPGGTTSSGGHVQYGRIGSDIGYLVIPTFAGQGWDGEVDEALDRLGDVRAMIVDIRNNDGGNRNLALDVAGRFTDRARTFGYIRLRNGPGHGDFTDFIPSTVSPRGSKKFLGPVFVLSNRHDFSSAEDFILAMRGTGRVTVVGDTTAGAAGGPLVRELANGWTYVLSQWIEYTEDRRPFEGVGLAPDVVVSAKATLAATGADPVLERATALALSGSDR